MILTDALLLCADTYCGARKIRRPTLSGLVFKDSRTLDRVAAGGSLTVRNFEWCMTWMSKNWPADLAWPQGVERPSDQHCLPAPKEAA